MIFDLRADSRCGGGFATRIRDNTWARRRVFLRRFSYRGRGRGRRRATADRGDVGSASRLARDDYGERGLEAGAAATGSVCAVFERAKTT